MTSEVRYVEVRGGNSMSWPQFFFWVGFFAAVQLFLFYVLPAARPIKYEYRTYYLQASEDGLMYGQELNKFGGAGWELTGVVPVDRTMHACYFRRPSIAGGRVQRREEDIY